MTTLDKIQWKLKFKRELGCTTEYYSISYLKMESKQHNYKSTKTQQGQESIREAAKSLQKSTAQVGLFIVMITASCRLHSFDVYRQVEKKKLWKVSSG